MLWRAFGWQRKRIETATFFETAHSLIDARNCGGEPRQHFRGSHIVIGAQRRCVPKFAA